MAPLKRISIALRAILVAGIVSSCTEPVVVTIPAGTYDAATYTAGTAGGGTIDMLTSGLTWWLVVADDGSVVSTMRMVSPTMTTETSRDGVVRREESTVTFIGFQGQQPMLTQRVFTLDGAQLSAVDQTVDGVTATIRFTRR